MRVFRVREPWRTWRGPFEIRREGGVTCLVWPRHLHTLLAGRRMRALPSRGTARSQTQCMPCVWAAKPQTQQIFGVHTLPTHPPAQLPASPLPPKKCPANHSACLALAHVCASPPTPLPECPPSCMLRSSTAPAATSGADSRACGVCLPHAPTYFGTAAWAWPTSAASWPPSPHAWRPMSNIVAASRWVRMHRQGRQASSMAGGKAGRQAGGQVGRWARGS